ncbi:MAG: hypothetical protein HYS05_22010 [Acidobacteria bacterium]|nr:hypothetical protein [Acidobacteriota bacterium]
MMHFANPLPWWAVVLLAAFVLLVAYGAYARPLVPLSRWRRLTLSAVRAVALGLLVLFLLRPVVFVPPPLARAAIVPVLVDVSQSMALTDVGGRRRIDAAADLVKTIVPALNHEFQTEILTFGERVESGNASTLTARARRTDLSGALRDLHARYRGRTVAGIVLVTDGGETGIVDPAQVAQDGPAVFPVGVGSPEVARDREVVAVTAGDAAMSSSLVDLNTTAVSHQLGTGPIELRVLANGRLVDMRRVTPAADGSPISESFSVSPASNAATLYTVEVPEAPGELAPENNRRSVLVPPAGRRRRVLVVEGAPGFDHTFLKRALAADPGIEVDSVVRKGANEQGQPTYFVQADTSRAAALSNGFPASKEAVFAYDALILANVEWDFFSAAQLEIAADFVGERGGGVLALGARSLTERGLVGSRLEEVLPVELSDRRGGPVQISHTILDPGVRIQQNRAVLTPDGVRHPVMRLGPTEDDTRRRWEALPALSGSAPLGDARPGATVLAVTGGTGNVVRPLVAVQRYGRGRSMVFGGDASWRWRMMLSSDDRTHEMFWRQAARWLASGAPDPVTIAPVSGAAPGDVVSLDVTARDTTFASVADASVTLRIAQPGGEAQELTTALSDAVAGRYTASFKVDRAGVYRVTAEARRGTTRLGTSEQWILVGGAELEMSDPKLNEDLLRRVAITSGGRYLTADRLADLPRLLERTAPPPPAPEQRDLWHNGWSFAAIILLLCGEWTLRRRWGLR